MKFSKKGNTLYPPIYPPNVKIKNQKKACIGNCQYPQHPSTNRPDVKKAINEPRDTARAGYTRQHQLSQRTYPHCHHAENSFTRLQEKHTSAEFTYPIRCKNSPCQSAKHRLNRFP